MVSAASRRAGSMPSFIPSITHRSPAIISACRAPLLGRRFDLLAVGSLLPVVPVDVQHRQVQPPAQLVRQRRLARAPAADHRDALHRRDATAARGRVVVYCRGWAERCASCLVEARASCGAGICASENSIISRTVAAAHDEARAVRLGVGWVVAHMVDH